MPDRILIIDGLNFIYRGLVKIDEPQNYNNFVVYQFFRNLKALIDKFNPDHCFFILEGNPEFRKNLFSQYKQNRIIKESSSQKKKQDNFFEQVNIIINLLQFLPIRIAKSNKYEADDVIYSLTNNLQNESIIIVSSDSDLIQILQKFVGQNIQLYNPIKKIFITAPNYVYTVWKALAGDKSDNIPGIVSNKKALNLSQNPQELKQFLQNEENRANFSLNLKLIELVCVPTNQLDIVQFQTNLNALFNKFIELKFESLLLDKYKNSFYETFSKLS